jgi:uncharacterized lipoprotein
MRLIALLAAVAFILVLAGCSTELDAASTEDTVKAELERTAGIKISSVDCPSGVEVKVGATFECTLTEKGGGEQPVKLKIINDDADLKLLNTSSFE